MLLSCEALPYLYQKDYGRRVCVCLFGGLWREQEKKLNSYFPQKEDWKIKKWQYKQ